MKPEDVSALFVTARETFGGMIEGPPSLIDLRRIHETLFPLLLDIPYDEEKGVHSLVGIILPAAEYQKDYNGKLFTRPSKPAAYDESIDDKATNKVVRQKEAIWKAKIADYQLYAVAKREARHFLLDVVEDTWVRELRELRTYYTKVTALQILVHMLASCSGGHAIDALSLQIEMREYHTKAHGIPEYINMLEDAQKQAVQIDEDNPITDKSVLTIATAAMLKTGQFPEVVREWEKMPKAQRTWDAWKKTFKKAHSAERLRLQATGGANSFGSAGKTATANAATSAPPGFSRPTQSAGCAPEGGTNEGGVAKRRDERGRGRIATIRA